MTLNLNIELNEMVIVGGDWQGNVKGIKLETDSRLLIVIEDQDGDVFDIKVSRVTKTDGTKIALN